MYTTILQWNVFFNLCACYICKFSKSLKIYIVKLHSAFISISLLLSPKLTLHNVSSNSVGHDTSRKEKRKINEKRLAQNRIQTEWNLQYKSLKRHIMWKNESNNSPLQMRDWWSLNTSSKRHVRRWVRERNKN